MSKKKSVHTKKNFVTPLIIGICALVLVLCGVGGWLLHRHLSAGEESSPIREYNIAVTNRALSNGYISEDEVLLTRAVTVRDGDVAGYVMVEFNIYKLPENADTTKILGYQVSDIPADSGLELVGTASARLLNGKVTSIYDLNVSHEK